MPLRLLMAAALIFGITACGAQPELMPRTSRATPIPVVGKPGDTITVDVEDRPFQLHIPTTYRSGPTPLVVLLHGFTGTGSVQEAYFKLLPESDRRDFLYAMPDGTTDPQGRHFWNATDACCNLYGSTVDDSTYLSELIRLVQASYGDGGPVFLVGHSNGGYMSYRMACDHADQIAAIVALAGAMFDDTSKCKPSRSVSVLEIHGDADTDVPFYGSASRHVPSVATTIADWVAYDGCGRNPNTFAAPIDLDTKLPGPETTITQYWQGCRDATTVELWRINGGGHGPSLSPDYPHLVIDWLFTHAAKR
jgi:polyhydroxybutyrate depolymerase